MMDACVFGPEDPEWYSILVTVLPRWCCLGTSFMSRCTCKSALHLSAEIRTCCFFFQATGKRVLPPRACSGVPLSRSVPETADLAETRGEREARTGADAHLVTDHAVLCPILHSLCW